MEWKTESMLLFYGNSNHPLVMKGNITFFPLARVLSHKTDLIDSKFSK